MRLVCTPGDHGFDRVVQATEAQVQRITRAELAWLAAEARVRARVVRV